VLYGIELCKLSSELDMITFLYASSSVFTFMLFDTLLILLMVSWCNGLITLNFLEVTLKPNTGIKYKLYTAEPRFYSCHLRFPIICNIFQVPSLFLYS
jgi:hypothetical protein